MMSWKGLDELTQTMRTVRKRLPLESKEDVEVWGRTVEYKAKTLAPVDLGKLVQSIQYESTNNGNGANVTANEPYSGFVEFGTGSGVLIPPGWEELARRFRGKGERQVTISAQPYLYPASQLETPAFFDRLQNRLKQFFL